MEKRTQSHNGSSVDQIVSEIGSFADNAKDLVRDLQRRLNERMETAYEGSKKAAGQVNEYARENPWRFAAIAMTAGLLAGFFLRRKEKTT